MKLLLLSLFFFSSLFGAINEFQKDDYQILIGERFDDEALDLIEDHDNGLSVLGYTQHFKTDTYTTQSYHNAFDYLHDLNAKNGEQLRIIKLDQAADIIQDKSFKLPEFNRGTNILKTVQNGYLVGGYTHKGQMIIASLDAKANATSIKKLGTENFDRLNSLVSLNDGGSVVIGTSKTSRDSKDNMFIQGMGKNDIYLLNLDPNGNIRWKKKYGSKEKDIGVDGVATDDGGFILIGTTKKGNNFQLMAAKISDTGDTTWMQTFPKAGRQKAYKIVKITEDNYLISASFENKDGKDNIRMISIDNEGNILWEKNYFNEVTEHLNDIAVDLKGNIIGVGSSQGKSDRDALVRYYDNNGKFLWERKFGKERHDVFNAVSLLHDNSFAIAGFSNSFSDKGRQIWILKLYDDGSIVKKKIKKYQNLYEALKEEFKDAPSVHIYKDLRITHKDLIFQQGSSDLTPIHKTTLNAFMPRLMKILSLSKTEIKNIRVNGYTSTEWNAPETERYLNNARLSNNRAMNILDYSYQLPKIKRHQKWISQVLSTDGYSYSNLIYADKKENKVRSRRAEFKIILN